MNSYFSDPAEEYDFTELEQRFQHHLTNRRQIYEYSKGLKIGAKDFNKSFSQVNAVAKHNDKEDDDYVLWCINNEDNLPSPTDNGLSAMGAINTRRMQRQNDEQCRKQLLDKEDVTLPDTIEKADETMPTSSGRKRKPKSVPKERRKRVTKSNSKPAVAVPAPAQAQAPAPATTVRVVHNRSESDEDGDEIFDPVDYCHDYGTTPTANYEKAPGANLRQSSTNLEATRFGQLAKSSQLPPVRNEDDTSSTHSSQYARRQNDRRRNRQKMNSQTVRPLLSSSNGAQAFDTDTQLYLLQQQVELLKRQNEMLQTGTSSNSICLQHHQPPIVCAEMQNLQSAVKAGTSRATMSNTLSVFSDEVSALSGYNRHHAYKRRDGQYVRYDSNNKDERSARHPHNQHSNHIQRRHGSSTSHRANSTYRLQEAYTHGSQSHYSRDESIRYRAIERPRENRYRENNIVSHDSSQPVSIGYNRYGVPFERREVLPPDSQNRSPQVSAREVELILMRERMRQMNYSLTDAQISALKRSPNNK